MRLFLALLLPETALDVLAGWQAEHIAEGRRVPRENLHVTLAFLGGRPAPELPSILDALRGACRGIGRIAFTPSGWHETRSVGMVVLRDVDDAAAGLARRLHAGLEELGVYRPESRPWLPHVTVVRFRERPRLDPPLPAMGTFVPSDAAAFLSRLHPTGARYEVLERVSLIEGG